LNGRKAVKRFDAIFSLEERLPDLSSDERSLCGVKPALKPLFDALFAWINKKQKAVLPQPQT